jgi:hypothetical protein
MASRFEEGDLVWAKMKGFPWWPGMVFPSWDAVTKWRLEVNMGNPPVCAEGQQIVYFFETLNFNVLPNLPQHIVRFVQRSTTSPLVALTPPPLSF